MVTRARFEYRPGIERELANDGGIGKALGGIADDGASAARALAPVRTGAYRSSISASVERGSGGYVARTSADVAYASFIEYGTSDTPTFAPIRRGLEAVTGKGI